MGYFPTALAQGNGSPTTNRCTPGLLRNAIAKLQAVVRYFRQETGYKGYRAATFLAV